MKLLLRAVIRKILESKEDDLLVEPDEIEGDEETEASGAAAVAGYTLPLGMSNSPSTLKQRGIAAGQSFGGARPVKRNKKKISS